MMRCLNFILTPLFCVQSKRLFLIWSTGYMGGCAIAGKHYFVKIH